MAATSRTNEEKQTLYDGASVSELATLFNTDKRDVTRKIRTVQSTGTRGGHPIYPIGAAAKFLVDPDVDIAAWIKKLRPQDLPPMMQKDFWSAQNERQKYEISQQRLWKTEDVQIVLAEAFKAIRTSVMLHADTVENRAGLTEEQRKIIYQLQDVMLEEVRGALIESRNSVQDGKAFPAVEIKEALEVEEPVAEEEDEFAGSGL